jgi:predicted ATPase
LARKRLNPNREWDEKVCYDGSTRHRKDAIIRQLELEGFSVVEEAATNVIAAAQARGTS